ncbi:hypothetical protein Apa02nite_094530 [Actinoplanes palleronii]|uniref:Transposase n=1 Tax=Actinoplanes palleronii TaxID=113570 RepID=A0ABQ4BT34_9ACTN|nr:hypothetical protein Apa02nite_094530 [Actinoplanes palleronii]
MLLNACFRPGRDGGHCIVGLGLSRGDNPARSRHRSLESRIRGNSHVRFGGRPRGKGPTRAPRCAAHPTQATKTGLGLDQHQHRRWKAWHRWTTLVITAHAFLAAATTASSETPHGLIAITVNELRRLFHALIISPARRVADAIAWSIYRRRHQATAKTSHYARQALTEP